MHEQVPAPNPKLLWLTLLSICIHPNGWDHYLLLTFRPRLSLLYMNYARWHAQSNSQWCAVTHTRFFLFFLCVIHRISGWHLYPPLHLTDFPVRLYAQAACDTEDTSIILCVCSFLELSSDRSMKSTCGELHIRLVLMTDVISEGSGEHVCLHNRARVSLTNKV